MNPTWVLPVIFLLSYLVGSVPFGYLLVALRQGEDIRKIGSGNIGATNVRRILGRKWSYAVLLLDMLKGFMPVFLTGIFLERGVSESTAQIAQVVAGIGALIGHNWTVFLGFKGGKGVATGAGIFLCIAPRAVGVCLVVFGAVRYASRFISAGSLAAAGLLPVVMYFLEKPPSFVLFSLAVSGLIVLRHSGNIKRLAKGMENKV